MRARFPRPRRRELLTGLGAALIAGGALALFAALPGRPGQTAHAAANPAATVDIHNFTFVPGDMTVAAGATVVWKNGDDSPHRIAAVGGGYASPALDSGDSYSHTFAAPGVYRYICSLHPYMRGTITVKPATGS
jgi:plastocyanin